MEKRQYHKEMAAEIEAIPAGTVPKLLLHSCCGPCSTAVLEQLVPHFEIVLFYYNPNIAPREEYEHRLATQKLLLKKIEHPHPITLIAPPYDDAPFWKAVRGAEGTPEMGERCERCIEQRMRESMLAAIRYGCDYFTTTLSVSPHKNAPFINACGEQPFLVIESISGTSGFYAYIVIGNCYVIAVDVLSEDNEEIPTVAVD